MSEDDIDLDRVVIDPRYRRKVIEYLNGKQDRGADNVVELYPAAGGRPGERGAAASRDSRT